MSTDVQNLNTDLINILNITQKRIGEAKLLITYLKEVETNPVIYKLLQDIIAAHVSCTVALANLHGIQPGIET